jgi:hypothetical protein
MTRLQSKFNSHLPELLEAVDGTTDLRSNRKLYKKVYKYYKEMGIIFTGDSNTDYNVLIECLYEELT